MDRPEYCTKRQRATIFGPITNGLMEKHKIDRETASLLLKEWMIKRGFIKESRSELTKDDATKIIDGMCRYLNIQL